MTNPQLNITVGMAVAVDEAVEWFKDHDDPWALGPDLEKLADELARFYRELNTPASHTRCQYYTERKMSDCLRPVHHTWLHVGLCHVHWPRFWRREEKKQ